MYEKAITEALTLMEQAPSLPLSRVALAQTYAAAGKQEEAKKTLSELMEVAQREYVSPYGFAVIYADLGDKDRAFAWLEKSLAARDVNLTLLRVEPEMDSLRSDPRFTALQQRVRPQQ